MPDHALVTVPTARVLPAREIAATINRFTGDPSARQIQGPRGVAREISEDPDLAAAQGIPIEIEDVGPASPAGLVCPDCGGSMFDMSGEAGPRYRCRVGHGWTAEALNDAHGRQLEQALWAAVRVLEENQSVQRRLVDRAVQSGREQVARRVAARQEQRDRLASMLRAAIEQFGSVVPGNDSDQDEHGPATPTFGDEPNDEAVL
jgi:two-component system chemotaxis response regulator CheB